MKKFLLFTFLILAAFIMQKPAKASNSQGCPMPSAEKLVCEVVLCNPIGLAISESRSECLQVMKEFSWYLATLGFWSKPPKCKMRDKNCNKIGRAKSAEIEPEYCYDLNNDAEQRSCLAALGIVDAEYCDQYSGEQRETCEAAISPDEPIDPFDPRY